MPAPLSSLKDFLKKLEARAALNPQDRDALLNLPHSVKAFRRHDFIVREDATPRHCCVIICGFAMRHKSTGSGGRQIFSIHMRGDPVDLHNSLLGKADHSVQMLSDGKVALIPIEAIRNITAVHPALSEAMWKETLVDAAIFREWTLNVGQRDGRSRMAHMLCEFALRLDIAGLRDGAGYELPMTQEELGDALALTSVHINRTLKALAAEGLLERTKRSVKIIDWHSLAQVGDFDPGYLHLSETHEALIRRE